MVREDDYYSMMEESVIQRERRRQMERKEERESGREKQRQREQCHGVRRIVL